MTTYLEDVAVGQEFVTAGRTVTYADIAAFCGVSGDFNPLHTDEVWVRENTDFPGRVAHGVLVLAISTGLRCSSLDSLAVIAYLEEHRRFLVPVLPGDTVHARYRIETVRPSRSKPDRGVVQLSVEVCNQRQEAVQTGSDSWLVRRRPAEVQG